MFKFFDYWRVNQYNGLRSPSEIHSNDNMLSGMISRYLLQRAMSVYKWSLPESINERYFLYTLFMHGNLAVFYSDKYGVVAQRCSFKDYDLYYQPKKVVINNTKFFKRSEVRTLDVDAVLFTLEQDYFGCGDLISFFVGGLCELWQALMMNCKNSHLAYLFGAENKSQADSMKAIFDDIASGKPAVFYDKSLHDKMSGKLSIEQFNQNIGQNYIVDRILNDIKTLLRMYDSFIGIPNANLEKRERMISDEVNQNNIETLSIADMWLQRLQKNCKQVNEMFADQLTSPMWVGWRYPEQANNTQSESEVTTNE